MTVHKLPGTYVYIQGMSYLDSERITVSRVCRLTRIMITRYGQDPSVKDCVSAERATTTQMAVDYTVHAPTGGRQECIHPLERG